MEQKMKILLVEDDTMLAEKIAVFLEKWGYETTIAENFEQIDEEFLKASPSLVLMDINLPCYDGFYWCSQIRRVSQVPIIYISSRGDDRDKIMAIAQGGDDYVEKPFRLELLNAKIEAVLRRTYHYRVRTQAYLGSKLSFDQETGIIQCCDRKLELTKLERKIISRLLENKSAVVTREELMMALWSTDEFISDGSLTTAVSRLRSKLKELCGEEIIITRKGIGYLIP